MSEMSQVMLTSMRLYSSNFVFVYTVIQYWSYMYTL